jgi:outer membrane biosynthesis protein TonB
MQRRKHVRNSSSTFVLLVLVFAGGCVTDRHIQEPPIQTTLAAPPLPEGLSDGQDLLDCYPNVSKRLHDQGRVVVKLQIGASGAIEQPLQIDRERTDATSQLEAAALKIFSGRRFGVGEHYKKNVAVSVVFEG